MYRRQILEIAKENQGIVTRQDIVNNNIPTIYLTRLEKEGIIYRVNKGIYLTDNGSYDEYYFFQYRYKKAIYSYVSSLYLLGLTDKIPQYLEVTVPNSYKLNTKQAVLLHYVKSELYELGICEQKTVFGNVVRSYDAERTICDLIAHKDKVEQEIYISSIKRYVTYKKRNLKNLLIYADKMKILNKVRELMEIYFE